MSVRNRSFACDRALDELRLVPSPDNLAGEVSLLSVSQWCSRLLAICFPLHTHLWDISQAHSYIFFFLVENVSTEEEQMADHISRKPPLQSLSGHFPRSYTHHRPTFCTLHLPAQLADIISDPCKYTQPFTTGDRRRKSFRLRFSA